MAMLGDVLEAVSGIGRATILSRPGFDEHKLGFDVDVIESSLELNDALNELIEDWQAKGWPTDLMIVMADLALLTREDLLRIQGIPGDVVLSPGYGGGTNIILIRRPEFRTCYTGISFPKHLDLCQRLGITAGIHASYWAGFDIDEPDDMAEILIHGQGRAKNLLKSLGFHLSEHGRAVCIRGNGLNETSTPSPALPLPSPSEP
jgi:2-phospho-L-lactate/phosphoenolpyruvate guanylyltransferase